MNLHLLFLLTPALIAVLILVALVWLKEWRILLGISILAASTGFLTLQAYVAGDMMDTLSPGLETRIGMLELATISFLKAIFILLLAIFAWLQKEYRHY